MTLLHIKISFSYTVHTQPAAHSVLADCSDLILNEENTDEQVHNTKPPLNPNIKAVVIHIFRLPMDQEITQSIKPTYKCHPFL